MENSRLVTVLLIIVLTLSSSCNKDDEIKESVLIGTWEERADEKDFERCVFVFKKDNSGQFISYEWGVKANDIQFNYTFDPKMMELSIVWIDTWWESTTDMIEIRNENILIYHNITYYKR